MYNIVNVPRNYQGLINLEKLIVYKNNDKTIQMMKNYIENNDIENRKVDIKEVKKTRGKGTGLCQKNQRSQRFG